MDGLLTRARVGPRRPCSQKERSDGHHRLFRPALTRLYQVKEFLSRNGLDFTVKNVDADTDAFNEMVALGLMTIPVTIVDDIVVRGFDEKKLRAAVGLG